MPKREAPSIKAEPARDARKQANIDRRKRERAYEALSKRVSELEARIADAERSIKEVEQQMALPDFYADQTVAKAALAKHQELMWQVGELLSQWEMLQAESDQYADLQNQ